MTTPDPLTTTLSPLHATYQTIHTTHIHDITNDFTRLKITNASPTLFTDTDLGIHRNTTLTPPPDHPSLIIIAIPHGITPLTFHHHKKTTTIPLPPTYTYTTTRTTLLRLLTAHYATTGHTITPAPIPYKHTATHSGLATYGKNNLAYIPGNGSFHRLEAYYTTAPLPDHWQPATINTACTDCTICTNACPTHAISPDRFLLHVERCLTYHNEREQPFPNDIPADIHHAIVGCLHCQIACPLNRNIPHQYEPEVDFTEEETTLILQNTPKGELPPALLEKLRALNLDEYHPMLSRNLAATLKGQLTS
jgi:epoxyqueuosine reductase